MSTANNCGKDFKGVKTRDGWMKMMTIMITGPSAEDFVGEKR